ncbi:GNAT family N-acetyltransferase [Rhizobium sp. CNPSo 4039]|uniref:GNAT family N-acetyltransferase n=1 Tax=Rhizobium sp. CNPSo 4039 TaxID=3021409 RepID=UPI00254A242A|nr:GNAT family N-acetyltransferase [Rhizobium sp. CNPSo 4039]MDK4717624.1 GNAT family N-acetyltransferase [Rhizobium sp. CNPSo 4039]
MALNTLQGLTLSLIQEGHYFVLADSEGAILASGGWSRAIPDYKSHYNDPNPDRPTLESFATVRCVYVHPDHERRGYAKEIMQRIEEDAREHNVSVLALSSSRTALALYHSLDYTCGAVHMVKLPNGRGIELHEMHKALLACSEFPAVEEQRTKNECSSN